MSQHHIPHERAYDSQNITLLHRNNEDRYQSQLNTRHQSFIRQTSNKNLSVSQPRTQKRASIPNINSQFMLTARSNSNTEFMFGRDMSQQPGTLLPINGFRSDSMPKPSDLKKRTQLGGNFETIEPKTIQEKVKERNLSRDQINYELARGLDINEQKNLGQNSRAHTLAKALQHKLSTFEQLNLTEAAKNFGYRNFDQPESLSNFGKFKSFYSILGLKDVSVMSQEEIYTKMFSAFEKLRQELEQITSVNELIREEIDIIEEKDGLLLNDESTYRSTNLLNQESQRSLQDPSIQQAFRSETSSNLNSARLGYSQNQNREKQEY